MKSIPAKVLLWALFLTLAGSALLYSTAPLVTKAGIWTHTVLRNWDEYGLVPLHGKMVYNSGGLNAQEPPAFYGGHRPFTLYLAYALSLPFGHAGDNGMPFYVLLTALVAASVWWLLGKSSWALLVACAVALSPGYMRTTLILDPMTIPVMLGFLVMGWAAQILRMPELSLGKGIALAGLIGIYSLLNWTTAFAFAIMFGYLVAALPARPGRWLLFASLSGAAIIVIGTISILDKKLDAGPQPGFSLSQFYQAYLFGPGGYGGYPMTWPKAIVRIGGATAIGLLPLLVLWVWSVCWFRQRSKELTWRAALPLGMALLTVAGMRNYFSQHPWMAAPVIIFGLVFSLRVCLDLGLSDKPQEESLAPRMHPVLVFGLPAVCLAYGWLIALILNINSIEEDSLMRMVQRNTSRHDLMTYSPTQDPWMGQNQKRLEDLFDRKLVAITNLNPVILSSGNAQAKICQITTQPGATSARWIACTEAPKSMTQTWALQALDWYRKHISKRGPNDRFENSSTFYLYPVQ